MDGLIDRWINGWRDRWIDGSMEGWIARDKENAWFALRYAGLLLSAGRLSLNSGYLSASFHQLRLFIIMFCNGGDHGNIILAFLLKSKGASVRGTAGVPGHSPKPTSPPSSPSARLEGLLFAVGADPREEGCVGPGAPFSDPSARSGRLLVAVLKPFGKAWG